MNTSKRSKRVDRLSELPESLISHIFWLLPMRDVVRTTILSKNWKNLWTTISCLNFDNYTYDDRIDRFRASVNRALMFWRGISIQKFKIHLWAAAFDEPLVRDIDMWLRFAKDNQVQELYLDMEHVNEYFVPQYLLSYSSLKVLSLNGCSLQINGSVQWNQLKSLTITLYDEISVNNHVINQVMSGSPQLETLIVTMHQANSKLTVRSSSLKRLSIDNLFYFNGAECLNEHHHVETELRIRTPNLETLEIYGFPYVRCLIKYFPSLTRATLEFFDTEANDEPFEDGFLEDALKQILPTILHVQNVTLSSWCIEVLGEMKKKKLLSTMRNVTFLKIVWGGFEEVVEKAGVLEIFPQVKSLVIEVADQSVPALMFDANSHLNFQASLPNSFLLQLRRVEVTWAETNHSIFPLIQIVLKYACNLEKMVFRVKGKGTSSETLFLASQKLLRMPRSSPTAELIFPS